MNFGMTVDLIFYYDEYVEECAEKGIRPLTPEEWYNGLE